MDTIINTDKNIFGSSTFKWAITPESLFTYQTLFTSLLTGKLDASISERQPQANINFIFDSSNNQIHPTDSTEIPEGSVAVVRIVGSMFRYGNYYYWGADEITRILRYFDAHPNVIGIVLKIDTGGGQVAAVAPYKEFFLNKTKPVVGLYETCGSAGLWTGSFTDFAFAENNISAMMGSVGVMANFRSFIKYYEDLGIIDHNIKSNYSEDKNDGFDLAMKGDYTKIKAEHLDPLALKFQDDLKNNLPSLKADTPGLLTGKMFYAEDSLKYGLIDGIGTMATAIDKVRELAELQMQVSNFMNN